MGLGFEGFDLFEGKCPLLVIGDDVPAFAQLPPSPKDLSNAWMSKQQDRSSRWSPCGSTGVIFNLLTDVTHSSHRDEIFVESGC